MSVKELAIGEFCDTGSGGTPNRSNAQYYGGSIPWVKSGELREGVIVDTEEKITELGLRESSAKLVPNGAILLAMYGATVGRMALLGVDAATNQAVCNIRPDPRIADARYVFHGLQSKMSHFLSRAAGGAQPNISQAVVRETKLRLPPLDEQQRIAAILDKADSLRRKRRLAIEMVSDLTTSAFREMFGKSFSLPEVSLAELIDPDDRINYGVVQPGDDDPNGIFLVRVSDLQNGKVNHAGLRKVAREISNKHGRSVLAGHEILISCVGSIGGIALATEREKGFNIARAVARVPIEDRVLRVYVAEYLRSPAVQQYFTKELRTVSQPTLNIKQISETKVPLVPVARMQAFVQQVEFIRGLQEDAAAAYLKQDALFNSLQQLAFSGGLDDSGGHAAEAKLRQIEATKPVSSALPFTM